MCARPVYQGFAGAVIVGLTVVCGSAAAQPQFSELVPVVPPVENPITPQKRILGKILFWDEQMSSDNTTSCGTCHIPESNGTDPRLATNPGMDGITNTVDDIRGSFGVVDANDDNTYLVNPVFGVLRQVTGRSANSTINAAFADELFWDGRATSQFIDPQTGVVAIVSGGALESQAMGPPGSDAEMAHSARDWDQITAKLAASRPLALATNLTPDILATLAVTPTYEGLFKAAFGDGEVTSKRVAFAIATYERTLISNRSPWDDFNAGDSNALTPMQLNGWNIFQNARCDSCHEPPLFTDNMFRNIGNRPISLDSGRQAVTGLFEDRGKFKTPGLRNSGLQNTWMSAGNDPTLHLAVRNYVGPPLHPENVDPFMGAVFLGTGQVDALTEFIENGLLDPRVAAGTFPFDRPTLRSELPPNPIRIGAGDDNGTGFIPTMIANTPPVAGYREFKVGTTGMTEGTSMTLYVSMAAPVGNNITPDETIGATAAASGGAAPAATAFWPIADDPALDGQVVYFQWVVAATGARSRVARAIIFCGTGGCTPPCLADVNHDGMVTPSDFSAWIAAFNAGDHECDQNGDGNCTPADFTAWITNFSTGC